jgi:hypothetical protein
MKRNALKRCKFQERRVTVIVKDIFEIGRLEPINEMVIDCIEKTAECEKYGCRFVCPFLGQPYPFDENIP